MVRILNITDGNKHLFIINKIKRIEADKDIMLYAVVDLTNANTYWVIAKERNDKQTWWKIVDIKEIKKLEYKSFEPWYYEKFNTNDIMYIKEITYTNTQKNKNVNIEKKENKGKKSLSPGELARKLNATWYLKQKYSEKALF